jgi:hypothetical protein
LRVANETRGPDHKAENEVQNAVGRRFIPTLIGIGAAASILVLGVVSYGYLYPDTYRTNGPWGDFAGGLLNPVLTCLTFIGVLLTIALQRVELAFTREEVSRSADALEAQGASLSFQNFETTFFEMLKMNNEIIQAIDLFNRRDQRTTKGRDCFDVFVGRLSTQFFRCGEDIQEGYNVFWESARTELAHYFRFLFNFVRLVDENEESKPYHMRLLRSQLSDGELVLLFYNSLTPAGGKFRPYAESHALFDNLPIARLLDPAHVILFDRSAYGENAEALSLYDGLYAAREASLPSG